MISHGNDWTVFFTRPISGTLMALTALALLLPLVAAMRARGRQHPAVEAGGGA
jgi:putative tricarboxylic transport membrane protein